MNPQLQQLFTDLDAIAGRMDAALANAEAYGPGGRADLMMPHVNRAHDLTAAYGSLLRDAATWDRNGQQGDIAGAYGRSLDQPAKPATGLRPGEVVADVGADEGVYTGPVNEATLTDANRRYIANNLGAFSNKWGQVFNAKVRFPAAGGDAMVGEQDPLTPDGFDLSRYA